MQIHTLKCHPQWFAPAAAGDKTAEVRVNDRNYCPGDILILCEYEPNASGFGHPAYTGHTCAAQITHVLHLSEVPGFLNNLASGATTSYVVLSTCPVLINGRSTHDMRP